MFLNLLSFPNKKNPPNLKSLAVILSLVSMSFGYLLWTSWLKWGNLLVDTFSDQWVFYSLSQGKILYKDVFYLYGFLPAYIIAFLYKLFGVNIIISVYTGIFVTLMSAWLIYKIARFFLNRVFSTAVVLNFLFVFAFGCYCYNSIFNFILPYAAASTFFIMFALAAVYFFIRFFKRENRGDLFMWFIFMTCAFLSRPDICFAVWLAFGLCSFLCQARLKKIILPFFLFYPLAAAFFLYFFLLSFSGGFDGFKESVINILIYGITGKNIFERGVSGFDKLLDNLALMCGIFLKQLIAVSLLYLFSYAVFRFAGKVKVKRCKPVFFILVILISCLISCGLLRCMNYLDQYRLMPLLLLAGLLIYFYRLVQIDSRRREFLLVLFLVSLALVSRVVLNALPNQYGFFLLPIGLISYYIFFADTYPSLLNRILKIQDNGQGYYFISLLVFFVFLTAPFIRMNAFVYGSKSLTAVTERGKIVSFNDAQSRRFWETVDYLRKYTSLESRVVVFPEGIGINFFSRRDTPLPYLHFLPPALKSIGEDKIIHLLDRYKIDYIVITGRRADEYGYPFFGIDYGKELYLWVIENYKLVKQAGYYPFTSENFGAAIYKRK